MSRQRRATATQRGRATWLLCAAAVTAALAGCGSSNSSDIASKTPAEILAASKTAAEHASSVHIMDETAQGPLKVTLSLKLGTSSGWAQISLLGERYEVMDAGDALYVKGSPIFYRRLGITTPVASGTWVKMSENTPQASQLSAFANLHGELHQLLSATGPATSGATTTISGKPAIELKDRGALYTGRLYIATTGEPFPLKLTRTGRETGTATFTNWNQPINLTAPTNIVTR